jgi:hypothetical protein
LGQEHLARAKEVAHHGHARHQRPFDHGHGVHVLHAGLLGVGVDVLGDAVHQRMFQAFFHGAFAPCRLGSHHLRARCSLELLGEGHHALGGIGAARQQHVLHMLQQVLGDLVVHADLARVHDAHVHARLDGVVEEGGVHGLAHGSLPRKLKLMLLTPPLTSTPGRFSLIHFTAAM